ncbi:hypothetical protein LCGC14_2050880, partial [marine sediment metagenome]
SIVKEEFDPVFIGVSAKSFTEEIEIVPNIYDLRRCENKSVDVLDKFGYTFLLISFSKNIQFIIGIF